MGFMSSWIAIQQCPVGELLDYLNLEETGEEVFPVNASFSWAAFPNQWIIVFSQSFDWGNPARTRELSRFGLAVGCQFEDRVEMTSGLCAARDGEELWRIFHNTVESVYRLDVTGEPPNEFWSIRDRILDEQDRNGGENAGVDYIHEIPLELAQAICGYRADEDETLFKELCSAGLTESDPGMRKTSFFGRLKGVFSR